MFIISFCLRQNRRTVPVEKSQNATSRSLKEKLKVSGAIHKRRRNILGERGGLEFRSCKKLEGRSKFRHWGGGIKNALKNFDVFYGRSLTTYLAHFIKLQWYLRRRTIFLFQIAIHNVRRRTCSRSCHLTNYFYYFFFSGKRRFNIKLWKTFTDCFNCLPIAAIVDEKIFCCHGGLSPDLQSMEQIRRIMRPTDVPDTGTNMLDFSARNELLFQLAS